MAIEFTKDEAAYIDKNINDIVFNWSKRLINHIIVEAKNKNVQNIYINTSDTLKATGINENKNNYFYEKLPALIGFTKQSVNLRGKKETIWEYDLDKINVEQKSEPIENNKPKKSKKSKNGNKIKIEDIPSNRQGLFISIIGRKPFYTAEDVNKVISVVSSKKDNKNKLSARFYYDWNSKTYSGDQNFKSGVTENVVLQKLHTDFQNMINSDPILRKFWSYILSFGGHFGNDVIGFALVSKISNKVWVINEVQSDCINHYLDLRSKSLGWKCDYEKKTGVSWEVVKDMLNTHNKSNWISKIENNEEMKSDFMKNPDLISRLPENTEDIEKWISNNNEFSKYFKNEASYEIA